MPEAPDTELVLITQARSGDEKARAHLVQQYWMPLYQHLQSRTQRPEDAEDATVISFTKALQSLDQFDENYAFSTWLFRIGQNSLTDLHRAQKGDTLSIDDERIGEAIRAILVERPTAVLSPEEELVRKQRHDAVHEVIGQLKEHYRQLVELRYLKERSYEEIASELEMPLGSVKAKLSRARGLLASLFRSSPL